MRPIPALLKREMSEDPFYSKCCITGLNNKANKVDWHHNLIYGGKQVNEKWCILPLETNVHRQIVKYKEKCDWIMLNRATDEELLRYSKAKNYLWERERLNKIYGNYTQGKPNLDK